MLKRARLFGRLSPRWLRLATCRSFGAAADLQSLKELLRSGWVEGIVELARAWPPEQRTRLCAHLLDGSWAGAEVLLVEEEWRVAAAWSVLQNRPARLDDLVTRFAPADPAARSLLLLFSGRLREYEELDFDRRYLDRALQSAPPAVRTLLLRHTASLGRPDLVLHQDVPWCRLDWPEFEARLALLSSIEKVLPELRADQAVHALHRKPSPELQALIGQGAPDVETVRKWLSVPVELGRMRADYAHPRRVARQLEEHLEVTDWQGVCVKLPEQNPVNVVFSPDGRRLAVERGGGMIVLYSLPEGNRINVWSHVELFRFGLDGELALVQRMGPGPGSLWARGVQEDRLPQFGPQRATCMASRPERVVLGLESGEIAIWWGPAFGLLHLEPVYHKSPVMLVDFVGPEMLLTGTREEICLWRMVPPALTSPHLERLQIVARGEFSRFACASNRLAVASGTGVLGWSLENPRQLETFEIGSADRVGVSSTRVFACDGEGQVWCGTRSLGHFGPGLRGLYPGEDELVVLTSREAVRLSLRRNLIDLPLSELRRLSPGDGFLRQLFEHMHRFSIQLGQETVGRAEDIQL